MVTVTVHDDDGGVDVQTFTITVHNVAPTLSVVGDQVVSLATGLSIQNLGQFSDPGFDNPLNPLPGGELQETFAIRSIDWGDGTTPDTSSVSIVNRNSGAPGVLTTAQFGHAAYTYADDGDYTVTVRVADDDMGAFADPAKFVTGVAGVDFIDLSFTMHVNNVAPTLTSIVPTVTTISESESVSFTAFLASTPVKALSGTLHRSHAATCEAFGFGFVTAATAPVASRRDTVIGAGSLLAIPMSSQDENTPSGMLPVVATLSNVKVRRAPATCEVTARPM